MFKFETSTLLRLKSVVSDLCMVGVETVVSCRLGLNLNTLGLTEEFGICVQFAKGSECVDILTMSERLVKRA